MIGSEHNLKIGVIARNSLNDVRLWSGTVHYLSKAITTKYDIVPVVVKPPLFLRIVRKWMRIASRGRITISEQLNASMRDSLANKIEFAMRNGCTYFLAPAASDILSSGGIPNDAVLIYLSDATHHLMNGYYYSDSKHDSAIREAAESYSIARADAIIYSSNWARNDAIEHYHADPTKTHVIPFPAYLPDCYRPNDSREGQGSVINLLLVGVDWKRKGVDCAIECVEQLNSRDSTRKYRLTVVGVQKPVDVEYPNVKFMGMLHKDNEHDLIQLIDCYINADAFLLPTKAECAGIVYSEACEYGLPIFTYLTGGTADYVEDNINGRLIPAEACADSFANVIQEAVEKNMLALWSSNSRKKYERELCEQSWLDAFEAIVSSLENNHTNPRR